MSRSYPNGLTFVSAGDLPKFLRRVVAVVDFKGGGGGGSSAEYERQLAEQRRAREKAEAEAAELKRNKEATEAERKKRAAGSYLSGGAAGDENLLTRKTYLGSGS